MCPFVSSIAHTSSTENLGEGCAEIAAIFSC